MTKCLHLTAVITNDGMECPRCDKKFSSPGALIQDVLPWELWPVEWHESLTGVHVYSLSARLSRGQPERLKMHCLDCDAYETAYYDFPAAESAFRETHAACQAQSPHLVFLTKETRTL